MDPHELEQLAGIEYVGQSGISSACRDRVIELLQVGERVTSVRIITNDNYHALLLTRAVGDVVAVKSGFASGYGGEGPRCFSEVLCLLDWFGADIEEYDVSEEFLRRLDQSALTLHDLEQLDAQRAVMPSRLYDHYIDERHIEASRLFDVFPRVIPFSIVDERILDLAMTFWEDPDSKLLRAFRRLEGILRERLDSDVHGSKLFATAFYGKESPLYWKGVGLGEQNGRANLFTGCYMCYRNPRAHREIEEWDPSSQVEEFLLISHLFKLERQAELRI